MEIKWERGKYIKFIAHMKIRVGGVNPVAILKDDEFEYDGSVLKYAGAEYQSQGTRGACEKEWATRAGGSRSAIENFSPSRNIASATSVNRDLSRVQRNSSQALQTSTLDEQTVLDVSDRRPNTKDDPRAQPRVMTRQDNHRGMRVNPDVSNQEAVTIGRVRTPSHFKGNVYENAGKKEQLENITGSGFIPDENVIQREGVTMRTNVGKVSRSVRTAQEGDGVVVGKIRRTASSSEGIQIDDTSNIRPEREAKKAAHAKKAVPAKAAERPSIDIKMSPKLRMARRIDPDFPSDWSFTGRLSDRLDAAQKHGITPQFLEALYAAEGDQMRKLLEREYPKQFRG